MEKTEITFDRLPEAVAYLIDEMTKIHELLELSHKPPASANQPIDIEAASRLIMKAKSTIYTLVRKGLIPCYKIGNKLYFHEDELLKWIAANKKKSIAQTKAEIEAEMQRSIRHKPSKRFL